MRCCWSIELLLFLLNTEVVCIYLKTVLLEYGKCIDDTKGKGVLARLLKSHSDSYEEVKLEAGGEWAPSHDLMKLSVWLMN